MIYTEIRYRERTNGISGFPGREIPADSRYQASVQHVGTKLFGSRDEAQAWIDSVLPFVHESIRIDALTAAK